ncbi:MAG: hypothetical protein [Caudoviricetes sp.]|nr:MAG: hypothetical protein [Caudoviricetes sp.]
MNEIDRKLSKDYVIKCAKLPTKFGSLKELYEGISKEVFDIIGVEIITENVVYDGDRMAEYFVDRMPKLKDSKDIDEAYRSFKLLGKKHDTIKLYREAIESTWLYSPRCKPDLVDRLYKVAFGMIYGGLYFHKDLAGEEQII